MNRATFAMCAGWTCRRAIVARALVTVLALAIASASTEGQVRPGVSETRNTAVETAPRPRVGLVLSGGAAKGLAHIGVMQALEAAGIEVDVVAGTSMGALVGGLYAAGYSTSALDSLARRLAWATYFTDASERSAESLERRFLAARTFVSFDIERGRLQLPSGILAGQRISGLLAELTWPVQMVRDFRRFPRPFAAVATDLETGAAVMIDSGSLARAMRASMSLPSGFHPARINGRLLIDGGIARNLPAEEALALGAEFLICSDVGAPLVTAAELRSVIDVLMQTISFQMTAAVAEQRRRCDVLIEPDIRDLSSGAFDAADQWIERGRAAAEAALPRLQTLVRTPAERVGYPVRQLVSNVVRVRSIEIDGLSEDARRFARLTLDLDAGQPMTPATLQAAIDRLYATGMFESTSYEIALQQGDTVLVVHALARPGQSVGAGFRYDTWNQASLLLTAEWRHRLRYGSLARVEVRLGEQSQVAGHFVLGDAPGTRLLLAGAATYTHLPIDIFRDARREAQATVDATGAGVVLGIPLSRTSVAGLFGKGERATARAHITASDSTTRSTFVSLGATYRRDGLDRSVFPRRGTAILARAEWALNAGQFSQQFLDATVALPLHERLSLRGRATMGRSQRGEAMPLHYRFFIGGATAAAVLPEHQLGFVGLRPQERSGASIDRLSGTLQWEARQGLFTSARVDVGRAYESSTAPSDAWIAGVSFAAGLMTIIGPVELSASTRTPVRRPRLELSLGHPF